MKRRTFLGVSGSAAAMMPGAAAASAQVNASAGAALDYLAKHDPMWEVPAAEWSQGLPLGNGDLGVMIWGTGNPLIITLDKTDIWETRHWQPDPEKFKWREFRKLLEAGTVNEDEWQFHRPGGYGGDERDAARLPYPTRLPVGRMELRPRGRVTAATMRLALADGTASGELKTTEGTVRWRARVQANRPLILIELDEQGESCSVDCFPANDAVRGAKGVRETLSAWGYADPGSADGRWWQDVPEGGQYAAAWKREGRVIAATVAWTPKARTAVDLALRTVAAERAEAKLDAQHRQWWAQYWSASRISIPDTRLEGLYYLETYKLGAATRPDTLPLALHGPWTADGVMPPWSGDYHWNINVQETYWPIYTGNRLDWGRALYDMVDRARPRLANWCRQFFEREGEFLFHATDHECNPVLDWAQAQFEFNGLAWVAHHYWLHWRYSQDKNFLRTRCLPVMKAALQALLPELAEGADGKLHLRWSFSPEYKGTGRMYWGPDATIDLALIRFLAESLLEGHRVLRATDAAEPEWRRVVERLAPYPADASGLKVRADLPLETSHRHHSHLMPIWPLKLMNLDTDAKLIRASMNTLKFRGHGEWVGFPVPWAASVFVRAGEPRIARTLLLDYCDRWITENSFHMQGPWRGCDLSTHGNYALTLEAGFGFASAIQDMLLTSDSRGIEVFPGAPPAWDTAEFANLRTEGAFLVSARRSGGATEFVHVRSESGGTCRMRTNWAGGPPESMRMENGWAVLEMRAGEERTLRGGAPASADRVRDLPHEHHWFGLKRVPRV